MLIVYAAVYLQQGFNLKCELLDRGSLKILYPGASTPEELSTRIYF